MLCPGQIWQNFICNHHKCQTCPRAICQNCIFTEGYFPTSIYFYFHRRNPWKSSKDCLQGSIGPGEAPSHMHSQSPTLFLRSLRVALTVKHSVLVCLNFNACLDIRINQGVIRKKAGGKLPWCLVRAWSEYFLYNLFLTKPCRLLHSKLVPSVVTSASGPPA